MKNLAKTLLACVLAYSSAFAIDELTTFKDPTLLARYQQLTRELRCPKCQNETLADSDAPVAADLRRQLREMLVAGKSDDEILQYLIDRYGDFVLYKPPFVARTLILWSMPFIGLLIAGGVATVVIRRRAQLPIDSDTEEGTDIQ